MANRIKVGVVALIVALGTCLAGAQQRTTQRRRLCAFTSSVAASSRRWESETYGFESALGTTGKR